MKIGKAIDIINSDKTRVFKSGEYLELKYDKRLDKMIVYSNLNHAKDSPLVGDNLNKEWFLEPKLISFQDLTNYTQEKIFLRSYRKATSGDLIEHFSQSMTFDELLVAIGTHYLIDDIFNIITEGKFEIDYEQ